MALTFTKVPGSEDVWGHQRTVSFDIKGDSSYPSGGYAISASKVGFKQISEINQDATKGLSNANVEWDATNNKLRWFQSGIVIPALVPNETVTIASNVGTLARVPAYILAIEARTAGTTGACSVIPVGAAPATTQCAVNFATGGLTFFATDAVTSARVCYIPMGNGPFIPANQVIDELVTLPNATTVNLANQAALVQYVYEQTTLLVPLKIIGTQNLPAAGQIQLNLVNSTNTTITDNAAQNTKIAKVTYWKKSAFPAGQFGYFTNASVNSTSSILNYVSAASGPFAGAGTFIPGYGVHHAALATNTDVPGLSLAPDGTAVTNNPVYDPIHNLITFVGSDSITREYTGGLTLNPLAFNAGGGSGEYPAGSSLTASTVRVRFFGDIG